MKRIVGYIVGFGETLRACGPFDADVDGLVGQVWTRDRSRFWVWTNRGDACEWVDSRGRWVGAAEWFKANYYRIIPIVRRTP